jgi:hypothetical protein
MGAYIYYRTEDIEEADRAWEILQEMEENQRLIAVDNGVHLVHADDLTWAKKERSQGDYMVDYFFKNMGRGDFKVSGCAIEEELGIDFEEMLELLTVIFEKLNQEVDMRYLAGSCAFGGDYFSYGQIDRITNGFELMSNIRYADKSLEVA